MENDAQLISKVLVIDGNETALGPLKVFCLETKLVGLRATASNLDQVLKHNIDLGAVLVSEEPVAKGIDSLELASHIHQKRPDLPIFLRRYDQSDLDGLDDRYSAVFSGAYCLSNLEAFKHIVQQQLFDAFYPQELVTGIQTAAKECITNMFHGTDVRSDVPFLVRDKIMEKYNSLIALESSWCRGYMMVQVRSGDMVSYIDNGKTRLAPTEVPEQDIQTLVSELTNEIWGAIKRDHIGYANEANSDSLRIQVPLFIDPDKRYISFGTTKPQLCYRYRIMDRDHVLDDLQIGLKLVFNLDWSPENYEQMQKELEHLIENGELEFF